MSSLSIYRSNEDNQKDKKLDELDEKKDSSENMKNKSINEEENQFQKLNDEQINSLKYEMAIELDKRTYCQYYLSLIKKKTFNFI